MPLILILSLSFGGLALGAVLAGVRGSWLDRAVVAAFVLDEAASALFIRHHGWGQIQWGPFIADVVLLAALLAIVVREPRTYTLILAMLQVVIVGVHVARLVPAPLHKAGYASALFVLTVLEIWTIVLGLAVRRKTPA